MDELKKAIDGLARDRIKRFERALKVHSDEHRRHSKRTSETVDEVVYPRPDSWSQRPDFDPYIVRKRSSIYAHAIQRALKEKNYEVLAPACFEVDKPGGGSRRVVSFGIPDEAVSRRAYISLMNKNRALLSSRSYAYRNDLNVFDAIDYISSEWRQNSRLYIAEFDLRDYFGSVKHTYVRQAVRDVGFHVTPRERRIIEAFLSVASAVPDGPSVANERNRGIPQGTSVSLFLANAALTTLDRTLERLNVGFARFSDDILIWGHNYEAVRTAVDSLFSWSEESGVDLSSEKSHGIQILSHGPGSPTEMHAVSSVEFLSHTLSLRSTGVGSRPMHKLKHQCNELIYSNLIRQPLAGTQLFRRLDDGKDRDYLTLISQLRRLLYGSLSERQVRRLASVSYIPRIHLSGKVANHPSIYGVRDWEDFDAWLSRQVWLAIRKREKLLRSAGFEGECVPWMCNVRQLKDVTIKSNNGSLVDGSLPSASLMAKVVSRSTAMHGNKISERPRSVY